MPSKEFTKPYTKDGILYLHCYECNAVCVASELRVHLVQAHGYVDRDGHVYKPRMCGYGTCKKSGIYQLGPHYACFDHKFELKQIAARNAVTFNNHLIRTRDREFADRAVARDKHAAHKASKQQRSRKGKLS